MANKVQREEKRRAARLRNKARFEKADEELDVEDEIEDDSTETPVEEQVEKDYYDSGPMMMYQAGPTSWDELDAVKMAREKAQQVREVTYSVQDLVSNIVVSNLPADKKAQAIQAVGDGFGKRLKEVEKKEKLEKEIDFDLLELEAMIAKDLRHISIPDRVSAWMSKAKLTTAAEEKLSDSDFALVVERDGKKIRKYPIHDKAHVRNALARAAQMMEDGGEGAADARAAMPKIKAAAKKMGIGSMEKESSSVMVEKDKTGNWRAVMWPSNNFIDWDGDILSEAAHMEYVEWANKNMDCSPIFLTWHKPGTMRKSRIDFVGYENGFLIMSAPLEEQEAAALLKAQTITDIGMSHGTIVLERDPQDARVVTKYRMVEVSDLPLKYAANPFTDFETLLKEADMSKDLDTKAYLATILGSDELADKFIAKAGIKQKALQDAGVESKEKPAEKEEKAAEAVDVEAIASQVFDRVAKELDVEGLNEYLSTLQENAAKVPVLEALVKNLATDNAEKLAEMIEPPTAKTLVWQKARASQSKDSILDEEKEEDKILKKAQPELGWLSQATGTQPVATK